MPHNCADGRSYRSASSFVAARRTRKEAAAVAVIIIGVQVLQVA